MKNKLIALLAAAGMVLPFRLGHHDNLQINGFIDGSYQHNDGGTVLTQHAAELIPIPTNHLVLMKPS